jgi:hypothetical protein
MRSLYLRSFPQFVTITFLFHKVFNTSFYRASDNKFTHAWNTLYWRQFSKFYQTRTFQTINDWFVSLIALISKCRTNFVIFSALTDEHKNKEKRQKKAAIKVTISIFERLLPVKWTWFWTSQTRESWWKSGHGRDLTKLFLCSREAHSARSTSSRHSARDQARHQSPRRHSIASSEAKRLGEYARTLLVSREPIHNDIFIENLC